MIERQRETDPVLLISLRQLNKQPMVVRSGKDLDVRPRELGTELIHSPHPYDPLLPTPFVRPRFDQERRNRRVVGSLLVDDNDSSGLLRTDGRGGCRSAFARLDGGGDGAG
jgi:hypothetical protein